MHTWGSNCTYTSYYQDESLHNGGAGLPISLLSLIFLCHFRRYIWGCRKIWSLRGSRNMSTLDDQVHGHYTHFSSKELHRAFQRGHMLKLQLARQSVTTPCLCLDHRDCYRNHSSKHQQKKPMFLRSFIAHCFDQDVVVIEASSCLSNILPCRS